MPVHPGPSVTKIGPKASPAGHAFLTFVRLLSNIMRGAFVVQLGPETRPAEGRFEGWVEEVDSCTELRFRTAEELLQFLGQRFAATMALASKNSNERQKAQAVLDKYKPCKEEDLVIRPSGKSKRRMGGK